MDFFSGVRSKKASPAEEQLNTLLLDDYIQLINTFELNQIASLTYGDLVCDEIFEVLETIISKPLDSTPVTLQKALAVLKHIMIYGAEKCVNSAYGLGSYVQELEKYNTILIAHQQKGAAGMWQRIQGGGVDKGGPVREKAVEISQLLSNINELQRIRHSSADPNSLVPVGSENKVGFVTDQVRHHILKKRIEEQQRVMIKSNLVKSEGGFGGGYNATDGKSVVGAAHGIEEMLKMAQREQNKYTDDQKAQGYQSPAELKILAELQAELEAQKKAAASGNQANINNLTGGTGAVGDLLDFGSSSSAPSSAPPQGSGAGDLLGDFGATTTSSATSTFNPVQTNHTDPFGFASSGNTSQTGITGAGLSQAQMQSQNHHDPFSGISVASPQPQSASVNSSNLLGTMSSSSTSSNQAPISSSTMSSQQQSSPPFSFSSSGTTNSNAGPPTDLLGANEQPSTTQAISGAMSSALGGVTSTMAKLGLASPKSEDASTPSISVSADTYGLPSSSSQQQSQSTTIATTSSTEDRFAALDALSAAPASASVVAPPTLTGFEGMSSPTTTDTASLSSAYLYGSTAATTAAASIATTPATPSQGGTPQQVTTPGTGQISQIVGTSIVGDEGDDDNPWVMGGKAGTGLGDPMAPPPGAAPPPPPMW